MTSSNETGIGSGNVASPHNFVVNPSAKRYHYNPPWEECNIDDAGADRRVITAKQLREPPYADFKLCKICEAKTR